MMDVAWGVKWKCDEGLVWMFGLEVELCGGCWWLDCGMSCGALLWGWGN
jgi:hypothetical protein